MDVRRITTMIALPPEARESPGIDHLGVDWEAHGHSPASYLVPHFDFHLYDLSEEEVEAIDCSDETKPGTLPATCTFPDIDIPDMGVLVGLCVPRMGMHALSDEMIAGPVPFEASMIPGYHGGEPVFLEPMISRAEYDDAGMQYRMFFTGFHSE